MRRTAHIGLIAGSVLPEMMLVTSAAVSSSKIRFAPSDGLGASYFTVPSRLSMRRMYRRGTMIPPFASAP